MKRVSVVGGGIAGLACAWELSQAGAAVTVIEKETPAMPPPGRVTPNFVAVPTGTTSTVAVAANELVTVSATATVCTPGAARVIPPANVCVPWSPIEEKA